jgi:hypothetical protein
MPQRNHLFLLKELVKRDFQGRYAGSLLSFLWSFVQPLWLLALFTFVFSVVLKIKLDRLGVGTRSSRGRSSPSSFWYWASSPGGACPGSLRWSLCRSA